MFDLSIKNPVILVSFNVCGISPTIKEGFRFVFLLVVDSIDIDFPSVWFDHLEFLTPHDPNDNPKQTRNNSQGHKGLHYFTCSNSYSIAVSHR
jgi:hypothetical protein